MLLSRLASSAVLSCVIISLVALAGCDPDEVIDDVQEELVEEEVLPTLDSFGIVVDSLETVSETIRRNDTLSGILSRHNVSSDVIHLVAQASRDVFDLRRLVSGRDYHVYVPTEGEPQARYVIYQPDPVEYVVFDLGDPIQVYTGQKETVVAQRAVAGTIESSLYLTLSRAEAAPILATQLSEVFAWQIDFHRIQRGDAFKVIYEEETVEDKVVKTGRILAAHFKHKDKDFHAFYFDQDGEPGYFDEEGNSLRKAFLQAPLRYTRISSRYTQRRFHPILRTNRPHLGTDYAAPEGTPIYSVGDGVVEEAAYTRGNGRYVKIRHNRTYQTQYLHMSRFAQGIRPGVRVTQGQVIGYVGQTGLATGPHLCYRFWKNGRQVDPHRIEMPTSDPVDEQYREEFEVLRDELMDRLNGVKKSRDTDLMAATV